MDTADLLPHLNAALNGAAGACLIAGRILIARRRIAAHRRAMLAALGLSVLFLISYLTYHFSAPIFVFRGQGLVRPLYYALLVSHVLAAAVAIPLILGTAWHGLHRNDPRHRRWARRTWPLWMFVSVSGVLVYLMLYQIYR